MVFWIEGIIFPFFYNHSFVAEQCCDLYRLVITEFYTLQSVTLFQAFYIIIVIADVAIGKNGIQCWTMYILWNLLVWIERSFGWSSSLLLFGQIGLYRFGHGFLVYAEGERLKLTVSDMDGFDHAYSFVLFVHFDLHDGFRFIV